MLLEGSKSLNSEWQSKSESGHNANRPHVALGMRNNMTTSNSNIGYGSQGMLYHQDEKVYKWFW